MLVASILFLYCSMALWKNARHKIYLSRWVRYCSSFFVQVGHQSTCATIGYHHFSPSYHVIVVRPPKIINNLLQDPLILISKSLFSVKNQWNISLKTNRTTIINDIFLNSDFKILYFLKMCPIFVGFVHNFGKSNNEIFLWKSAYFQ